MDDNLWELYLRGDEAAFSNIYKTYFKTLYDYGMRKTNQQEDVARDCIHDLFVKLWTNRRNIVSTDNIKYYLLAAFRNQLINHSNQENKRQTTGIEEADRFVIEFNAESDLIKKENISEQSKQIIAALEQLTARQKEVMYLRFFEGLSYENIAEMMTISVKGVYKLNYRALESLKSILNLPKSDIVALLIVCKTYFHSGI